MKKTVGKIRLVFLGWSVAIFSLFLYSFTQIDLNLTLSRVSLWQRLEKAFMYLGYFQRPTSTTIFLIILGLLFTFYFLILQSAKRGKLEKRRLWQLIILTVLILFLAYPAFSHDIFNYIFDAKTVAFYRQNPYQVKPLDFPDDPMTRFMHWTHRPSVYPPLWIGLSTIPFILGFGKFLFQLIAFKAMMAGFYLGTIWLIFKISEVLLPRQKIFNVAFYAFNPLVIIESLVSAHNDGVMAFFALLAFFFILAKKPVYSLLSWLFSIGVKYVTAIFLPIFFLLAWQKIQAKKINWQRLVTLTAGLGAAGILIITYRIGFQPWYLLWVLPFLAIKKDNQLLTWGVVGLSLGSLLRYTPFLYLGNWDPPVPTIKLWLFWLPAGLSLAISLLERKVARS